MEDRYLFRGKRIDNGEWVEGYLSYPFCTKKGNESYYFYAKDSLGFFCRCVVDASTICQCTGSEDMNGKLIWGNDIVKTSGHIFVCYWDEYNFEWGLKSKTHTFGLGYIDKWLIEVIGNIFDNPELLGSEE